MPTGVYCLSDTVRKPRSRGVIAAGVPLYLKAWCTAGGFNQPDNNWGHQNIFVSLRSDKQPKTQRFPFCPVI